MLRISKKKKEKTVILLEEYEYEGYIGQGSSPEREGDPERWVDFK